jgi:hypothetical protein
MKTVYSSKYGQAIQSTIGDFETVKRGDRINSIRSFYIWMAKIFLRIFVQGYGP